MSTTLEWLLFAAFLAVSVLFLRWVNNRRRIVCSPGVRGSRRYAKCAALFLELGIWGLVLFLGLDVVGREDHREPARPLGVNASISRSVGMRGIPTTSISKSERFQVSRGTFLASPRSGRNIATYRVGRLTGRLYVLKLQACQDCERPDPG